MKMSFLIGLVALDQINSDIISKPAIISLASSLRTAAVARAAAEASS